MRNCEQLRQVSEMRYESFVQEILETCRDIPQHHSPVRVHILGERGYIDDPRDTKKAIYLCLSETAAEDMFGITCGYDLPLLGVEYKRDEKTREINTSITVLHEVKKDDTTIYQMTRLPDPKKIDDEQKKSMSDWIAQAIKVSKRIKNISSGEITLSDIEEIHRLIKWQVPTYWSDTKEDIKHVLKKQKNLFIFLAGELVFLSALSIGYSIQSDKDVLREHPAYTISLPASTSSPGDITAKVTTRKYVEKWPYSSVTNREGPHSYLDMWGIHPRAPFKTHSSRGETEILQWHFDTDPVFSLIRIQSSDGEQSQFLLADEKGKSTKIDAITSEVLPSGVEKIGFLIGGRMRYMHIAVDSGERIKRDTEEEENSPQWLSEEDASHTIVASDIWAIPYTYLQTYHMQHKKDGLIMTDMVKLPYHMTQSVGKYSQDTQDIATFEFDVDRNNVVGFYDVRHMVLHGWGNPKIDVDHIVSILVVNHRFALAKMQDNSFAPLYGVSIK